MLRAPMRSRPERVIPPDAFGPDPAGTNSGPTKTVPAAVVGVCVATTVARFALPSCRFDSSNAVPASVMVGFLIISNL